MRRAAAYASSDSSWSESEEIASVVKKTFKERLLLSRFLVVAIKMVKTWSRDRDEKQPNAILFINEPNLINLSKVQKQF
jgi:hypothetical protein